LSSSLLTTLQPNHGSASTQFHQSSSSHLTSTQVQRVSTYHTTGRTLVHKDNLYSRALLH